MYKQLRFAVLAAAAIPVLLASGPARAVTVTVGEVGNTMTLTGAPLNCSTGKVANCVGAMTNGGGGAWDFDWNLSLNPDPFVQAAVGLTNNNAVDTDFVISVLLPIAPPQGPPVGISGSIQGGLTNSGSPTTGGFVSSTAPNAIYTAFIDGIAVRTLLNHPSSISTNVPNASPSFPNDNFGLIVPEVLGQAATTNIAIAFRFTLSPGDSASFTGIFEVVPEPGTAVLVGVGLLGLLGVRRRFAR